MIKLSSSHTMVLDREGSLHSLDLEAVHRTLYRSFRCCGIREPWIADHIAMVVEEQLTTPNTSRAKPWREDDVHAMIAALLRASGYDDVGHAYCGEADLADEAGSEDEFSSWDRERVRREIRRALPLPHVPCETLVDKVLEALAALALPAVTNSFLRQLAVHLLRRESTAGKSASTSDPADFWLAAPGQWPATAEFEPLRAPAWRGMFHLYPVSRIFPRARLRVDLLPLAAQLVEPRLAELALLPEVHRAAAAAGRLLAAAQRHVDQRNGEGQTLEPRLIVLHLDALIESLQPPLPPRRVGRLREEVRQIIVSRVAACTGPRTLITFRPASST